MSFDPDDPSQTPEGHTANIVAYLDPFSDAFTDGREDAWREAHEDAKLALVAIETMAKDATDEERQLGALKYAEAKFKRGRLGRDEVPGYVKPGEIMTAGPRREVNHNWTTQSPKKDMSRKGGTWDRMARAQGLGRKG
jgi:hypothetical protein